MATATVFIVDGLMYDEYPDERERIANLSEDRKRWQEFVVELQKRVWELESELEAVKRGMGA